MNRLLIKKGASKLLMTRATEPNYAKKLSGCQSQRDRAHSVKPDISDFQDR